MTHTNINKIQLLKLVEGEVTFLFFFGKEGVVTLEPDRYLYIVRKLGPISISIYLPGLNDRDIYKEKVNAF